MDIKGMDATKQTEVITDLTWTPEEEKALVKKIDLFLLPTIWLMYLLSYMDRTKYDFPLPYLFISHPKTSREKKRIPFLSNVKILTPPPQHRQRQNRRHGLGSLPHLLTVLNLPRSLLRNLRRLRAPLQHAARPLQALHLPTRHHDHLGRAHLRDGRNRHL